MSAPVLPYLSEVKSLYGLPIEVYMLEKQDLEMLIQICEDWGYEYGCKNKSWEVEEMKNKLEKILSDTSEV